jgi:hypothetical protein
VKGPLNLASRPVRNERLPALVFAVAAFAMLLVTVQHAVIAYRLLPGRSKALREEVAALRTESEQLDAEKAKLTHVVVSSQQKGEWAVIKALVDRRTFWWSKLFEVLEKTFPIDVKLLSVTPRMRDGKSQLDMNIKARNVEEGFKFVQIMEKRDEFEDVIAKSVSRTVGPGGMPSDEAEFVLTMRYIVPADDSPATPAEAAARKEAAAKAEGEKSEAPRAAAKAEGEGEPEPESDAPPSEGEAEPAPSEEGAPQ